MLNLEVIYQIILFQFYQKMGALHSLNIPVYHTFYRLSNVFVVSEIFFIYSKSVFFTYFSASLSKVDQCRTNIYFLRMKKENAKMLKKRVLGPPPAKTVREKCPNTEFLLVRTFLCSVQIQENTDQKKLRIWTLFTQ